MASLKEETQAKKLVDELKKKDYPAYFTMRDLKEKGTWYRVFVGNFDTKTEAQETLAKLKDKYKGSFIVVK